MEGWTKFEIDKPPVGVEVEIMYAGRTIKSIWNGTTWDFDPSGQVNLMWWRKIN